MQEHPEKDTDFDAIVVGAGFAGMYTLHRLRGLGLRVRVLEAGADVGGTWYWNRYPGARCDVQSLEYSYQFDNDLQHQWQWSEKFATQPEILRYIDHVAERYDLRRDIRFNTRVEAADWDEARGRWSVRSDDGETRTARYFILATGCLSAANIPDLEGMDAYRGAIYHTGHWPHEGVDFTGLRVGVIGTGSSGVQSIPLIARQAAHLSVFQRTPSWCVPAHNGPIDPGFKARVYADYPGFRAENKTFPFGQNFQPNPKSATEVSPAEREATFERFWQRGGLPFMTAFADLVVNPESNRHAQAFVARKIRGIVEDPETAEKLIPDTYIGCKRLCVDTNYYATYNRDNVTLVPVKETPIERLTGQGLVVAGREHALDAIVFATGFDAMTGAISRIAISGRGGVPLAERWAAGPRTYLGLATAGFPNMFMITGPGSPSVLTNMLPSIEQHVDWIADCLAYLRAHGYGSIEATERAEADWLEHVNEVARPTLFFGCSSWYLGTNVPGKPRVFMPYIGFPTYIRKCEEVVARDYEGFALAQVAAAGRRAAPKRRPPSASSTSTQRPISRSKAGR